LIVILETGNVIHHLSLSLERTRLQNIKETKKKHQLELAQRQGQYELASRLRFATIPELEAAAHGEGRGGGGLPFGYTAWPSDV
jgi:hypothetical protein